MTDEAKKRHAAELEFELPGSPEQVWRAIATGAGISAWFVPTEVEERVGGRVAFHLGPEMDSDGHVTVWEPPRRFCYEEQDWSGSAPPLATELDVEPRAGGTCRVRLVHSVFASSDDWDAQLESMKKGWPPFFEVLRLYLAHHADEPAESLRFMSSHIAPEDSVEDALWQAFLNHFGLDDTSPGTRLTLAVKDGPPLRGSVQASSVPLAGNHVLIRLEAPNPGVLLLSSGKWEDQAHVTCGLYLYGAHAKIALEAGKDGWQRWLALFDFADSRAPLSSGF